MKAGKLKWENTGFIIALTNLENQQNFIKMVNAAHLKDPNANLALN